MATKGNRLRGRAVSGGQNRLRLSLRYGQWDGGRGSPDIHVQVIVPLSGLGTGQNGVRADRLLVNCANSEGLSSFLDARGQAGA
jgi:hypothetical protein